MISAKLNVSKIDKSKLYKGEKGTYLDITLLPNKEGTDQYGNDFMVVQDIGKEARERGEKGPILGNARNRKKPEAKAAKQVPESTMSEGPDEDCPF